MTPPDDIKDLVPSSQPERKVTEPSPKRRRVVGPESEVRGGPEAPDASLDDIPADDGKDKI